MNAFLTGSQIYGSPTENSDIDLVVSMDDENRARLWALVKDSEKKANFNTDADYGGNLNLQFGRLNLIVLKSDIEMANWKVGTVMLERQGPVSRERAVEVLKALRDKTL